MHMPRWRVARPERLLAFLLAVVVIGAGYMIVRSRMRVRAVFATGATTLDEQEIIRLSGIALGDRLDSVKAETVSEALKQNGYLCLTDVEVRVTGNVYLRVRERAPRAVVNHLGLVFVVDEEDVLLEKGYVNSYPDLPVVTGLIVDDFKVGQPLYCQSSEQQQAMALMLSELVLQRVQGSISELNVGHLDNLFMVSRTGMIVRLGNADQMMNKMAWARASLEELVAKGLFKGTLDVSSGDHAVYTPPTGGTQGGETDTGSAHGGVRAA